ncbi:MAG: Ig-like domain-containing protein [Propionibacteriaceae bacterium]|jgi:hypothetical protein|nr:Ig-like domain-containing protein [Propionibacteriaceae bacterium]
MTTTSLDSAYPRTATGRTSARVLVTLALLGLALAAPPQTEASPSVDVWLEAQPADGKLPVCPGETYTLTVAALDRVTGPIPDEEVLFSSNSLVTFSPPSCVTGPDGRCSVAVTTTQATGGTWVVHATLDGAPITATRAWTDHSTVGGVTYEAPDPPKLKFWAEGDCPGTPQDIGVVDLPAFVQTIQAMLAQILDLIRALVASLTFPV